jgi:XRE family transcriptional regulator, fatty acid utilization regulator
MQAGTDKVKIIFGLKINQLRQQKGVSLQTLAKGVGFSMSYLNEIEKGKKFPKADKILALAEYFQVSYDQLVSLKLDQVLEPIAETLHSSVLTDLPLSMFGIEVSDLVELMSKNPSKFSALLNSIKDIARTYDITKESFYGIVLRSYQELNENYFQELETIADAFLQNNISAFSNGINVASLQKLLREKYAYKFTYLPKSNEDFTKDYCIVYSPKKVAFIAGLPQEQEIFQLSLLLAYEVLGFANKPKLLPCLQTASFEEQFQYFKAHYWAAAFLMPFEIIRGRLTYLLASPQWEPAAFLKIFESFSVSTSMFMYRLTSVLSGAFGLNNLFLLGMVRDNVSLKVNTTQQMHLKELHSPHGYASSEHYCRRWLSLSVLDSLKAEQGAVSQLQISKFADSSVQYLVLSLADKPSDAFSKSDTIGFVINKQLKDTLQFLQKTTIPEKSVGQTCERCAMENCSERVATASVYNKQQKIANSYAQAHKLQVKPTDWL